MVQLEDKKQDELLMKRNKPDEENKEAESGKDRDEGYEDQVTKMFGRRWEEEDLQKVGQYHISFLSTQYNVWNKDGNKPG